MLLQHSLLLTTFPKLEFYIANTVIDFSTTINIRSKYLHVQCFIFQITVTAKVVKKIETVQQELSFNRTMKRTTFIIADATAAIQLTLWGPEEQILVDNCYKFENLSIKTFECTKLSTTPYTKIIKCKEIEDVVDETLILCKGIAVVTGTISGATIEIQNKCFFCKNAVTINEDITSLKCNTCNKRQLVTTVLKEIKTEITVTTSNNNIETYNVPRDILDIFTLGISNYEDKELFLLQHNRIEMEVINKTVHKMKECL